MSRLYKVTDTLNGEAVWVKADSVQEALISRENQLRAAAKSFPRAGKPPLPVGAKVSNYSNGEMIDVSIADVSCVGLESWVIKKE